jgi:hypothetical protein
VLERGARAGAGRVEGAVDVAGREEGRSLRGARGRCRRRGCSRDRQVRRRGNAVGAGRDCSSSLGVVLLLLLHGVSVLWSGLDDDQGKLRICTSWRGRTR